MAQTQVRVGGGGNTYVEIGLDKTHRLEFLASMSDNPPSAKVNAQPIQGIGDLRPVEIALPYAQGAGTLSLTVWQKWGIDGWVSAFMSKTDNESGSDGTGVWDAFINADPAQYPSNGEDKRYPVDLVEIYQAQRLNPEYIKVKQFELGADGSVARVKNYEGCVITNVTPGTRNLTNDTMDMQVTIDMMYTSFNISYM